MTVFDLMGKRHVLRGKEGDDLVDILEEHKDEIGGDSKDLRPSKARDSVRPGP